MVEIRQGKRAIKNSIEAERAKDLEAAFAKADGRSRERVKRAPPIMVKDDVFGTGVFLLSQQITLVNMQGERAYHTCVCPFCNTSHPLAYLEGEKHECKRDVDPSVVNDLTLKFFRVSLGRKKNPELLKMVLSYREVMGWSFSKKEQKRLSKKKGMMVQLCMDVIVEIEDVLSRFYTEEGKELPLSKDLHS